MKLRKPFFRYLLTLPLPDLLLFLLLRLNWGGLIVVFSGGIFLLGMIGGAIWGGLPGLRWRTILAYTAVSLLLLPCPCALYVSDEPGIFWLLFLFLNNQQAAGFFIGAWCRKGS